MLRRIALLLPFALALGCHKAPSSTTAPTTPSGVRIPTDCEASLAGEWVHARDPSFRYTATDDGRTLMLTAHREPSPPRAEAGETPPASDGGSDGEDGLEPTITLERTSGGFRGSTSAEQFLQNGQRCEVPFPTEVTACSGESITLSTAAYVAVDAQCHPAPTEADAPREQHRLVRPGARAGTGPATPEPTSSEPPPSDL